MSQALLFTAASISRPGLGCAGGLPRSRRLRSAAASPGRADARGRPPRARSLRPARARGRGLPDGQEGLVPAQRRDGQVPRLQRRRVRAQDLQDPRTDAEVPAHADRGHRDRVPRRGREPLVHLHPRGVRPTPGRHPRRAALREAVEAGLGPILGSGHSLSLVVPPRRRRLHLRRGPGLLGLAGGQARRPAAEAPFPANQGLYQGPTPINNVETLSTVPTIIRMTAPSA